MKAIKNIGKSFKKILSTRKDVEIPAFLGNLAGTVKADNESNVYVVLFNGEVVTVRNVRVPNVARLPVVIGYDSNNPTLLQVIRARNTFVNPIYPDVPEHSEAMHQWPNPDVLWVRGEQILPGLAIPSALTVEFVGFVYYLSGWHLLENQTIDLSGEVPASGANYVLVEVDNAGAITFNAGASVASREVLTHGDIPTVTAGKMPLFAVKMYVGQSVILKSLLQSDIVDLRWSGWSAGGYLSSVTTDTTLTGDGSLGNPLGVSNIVTPANPLTLIAGGAYSLTIPATGTVMLGVVTDAYIPRSNAGILIAGAIRDNGSEIAIGTTINTAIQLNALRTSIATSGGNFANNTVIFGNPSGSSSANYVGIQLSARTAAVVHNFTGSIQGGTFNTIHTGSGTLSNQYAGRFQTQSTGGGVSTNAYALQILASTISGVGSAIANNYGLWIGNIVGSTLSYSIFTGTGLNQLGDQLKIDLVADKIGLIVQAHSTQTANIFEMQTSAAAIVNSMSLTAGTVLNEQGDAAIDLRAESDTEANMLFLDSSADALYLGGSTNGVKILKGGEFSLIGTATVWDDLRISPDVKGTGSKDPTWSAWLSGLYLYDFDNATAGSEKELWFNVQMPHGWKEGSSVYPHVHWVNDTAGTAGQVVRWGLEYTVAKIGDTFPAVTTVYGTTIVGGGDITVANEHLITSFSSITMTGNTISTILVCRLFRNSSDAADTYGGTAGLLSIDWHYEVDKIGSSTEFA